MEKTSQQFCFTHPGGEDIYLFTLSNSTGSKVIITNYGAIITSFLIEQKNGSVNDIVLGFDDVALYMDKKYQTNYPYFGAAIGRYGNRIKSGRFMIDGKDYQVKQNLGTEHLHGGEIGFDRVVWQLDNLTANTLTLKYLSKDGEEGYPGNLHVTLRFELTNDNELIHEYSAVTDKPTPVNLTHHSYFNLDNGEDNINAHHVKINASFILVQDDTLTVTGELLPVKGTMYDFREFKPINKDWDMNKGYDQSFVVDNSSPQAEAFSKKSGLKLQLFTTEPIVHLYTGVSIPSITGKRGIKYGPFSGFCLETHIHPNAVNIPHFPNTIVRPGEVYRQKTSYKIIEE
jgi:aldose 1-epimerase